MESTTRNYVLATVAVMAVTIVLFLVRSTDITFLLLPLILIVVMYPTAVIGIYMFLEAKGYGSVNGVDWDAFTETQKRNLASYIGLFVFIGTVVLNVSIMILVMPRLVEGLALMAVGTVIMLIPILMKGRFVDRKHASLGPGAKAVLFVVCSVMVLAPLGMPAFDEVPDGAVSLEFGEDVLVIRAPMADGTFEYGLIEDLEYDPAFDKGYRVIGYGTMTVKSGTFRNAAFGNYTLASYATVDPCVFFQYEGKYYAFNQADEASTLEAFEVLKEKVGHGDNPPPI